MKKALLIHNPRCSKSKAAFEILKSLDVDFATVDYLHDGLKEKLLAHLPQLLQLSYIEMIRTSEDIYKELHLDEKKFHLSNAEWIQILIEHPILLERPIFINGDRAVIGRPPERVKEII